MLIEGNKFLVDGINGHQQLVFLQLLIVDAW